MRYGNELKVGLTVIIAGVVFFLGVRYFENIPLFRGQYTLVTEFDNANGIIAGNNVRVRGLNVGSVQDVSYNSETDRVRVVFDVDSGIRIPEGTYTKAEGLEAFGSVYVVLYMGPEGNPALEDGDFVPSRTSGDLLDQLTDRAPGLFEQVDSVLTTVNATVGAAQGLLADETGDFDQTLRSVRSTLGTLDRVLREEQQSLSTVLENANTLVGSLNMLAGETRDSLQVTLATANQAMTRVDANLASLETTLAMLDRILVKIDTGQGTLGLLVNDPALYHKLDSTLTNVNSLVTDLQDNPARYIRHLRLVDLF